MLSYAAVVPVSRQINNKYVKNILQLKQIMQYFLDAHCWMFSTDTPSQTLLPLFLTASAYVTFLVLLNPDFLITILL